LLTTEFDAFVASQREGNGRHDGRILQLETSAEVMRSQFLSLESKNDQGSLLWRLEELGTNVQENLRSCENEHFKTNKKLDSETRDLRSLINSLKLKGDFQEIEETQQSDGKVSPLSKHSN